ncbi:MAG TPA: S8 family serine peptidase, partial [Pseudonocardiaceae bacterium]|nr:S8 family serine peptidase [Pseudonocardiaceae bacterium]
NKILLSGVLAALTVTGLATAPASASVGTSRPVCPTVPGLAHCLTWYTPGTARALDTSVGLGATDLESAYALPVNDYSNALIAVSIAYDAPNLEHDLNVYRTQYGLGPCTAANGCLTKVNQQGKAGPLPPLNLNWEVEETLDVSMISAACPHCRILAVEGNSPTPQDLAETENTAVALGAQVVTNSYGIGETGSEVQLAAAYNHPGHVIVASSGDAGYGPTGFPAALPSVTAVGGTVLTKADNTRGWTEAAWLDSSSGCSAYQAKPAWQHDKDCSTRTVADVSAAAQQIAIYNTDQGGWLPVNGTSASSPFIAGVYGLAGNASSTKPGYAYAHTSALYDVTSGNNDPRENGGACGNDYLCVSDVGYDGPTGLGSPNGIGAF